MNLNLLLPNGEEICIMDDGITGIKVEHNGVEMGELVLSRAMWQFSYNHLHYPDTDDFMGQKYFGENPIEELWFIGELITTALPEKNPNDKGKWIERLKLKYLTRR